MASFNIINSCEDLVDYVFTITDKSPKKLRLDIIPKLREYSFDIMENVIIANNFERGSEVRIEKQKSAIIKLRVLEATSEICKNKNYITKHQFETLTSKTFALSNQINN